MNGTEKSGRLYRQSVLIVLYAIVLGFGISRHEFWLDEAQAWMLARSCGSFSDIHAALRYENHPELWYYILFFVTKFTTALSALQVTRWLIAVLSIAVFCCLSPFSLTEKSLFILGYFPLYEFGVISRNYSLGLLFLFSFCSIYSSRKKQLLPYVFLVLVAFANFTAGLVALSLAFLIFVERATMDKRSGKSLKCSVACFFLFCVFFFFYTVHVAPEPGTSYMEWHLYFDPERVLSVLSGIVQGIVPLQDFRANCFWQTTALTMLPGYPWVMIAVFPFCVILMLGSLYRRPLIIIPLVLIMAALFLLGYLKGMMGIRHYGHVFILYVCCRWLQYGSPVQAKAFVQNSRNYSWTGKGAGVVLEGCRLMHVLTTRPVFVGYLCLHLIASIVALGNDWCRPFTPGRAAAEYITYHGLAERDILVEKDLWTASVGAYLNRPLFYLRRNGYGTYVIWDSARAMGVGLNSLCRRVTDFLEKYPSDSPLLLMSYEVNTEAIVARNEPFRLRKLATFADTDTCVRREGGGLWLYEVLRMKVPVEQ